MTTTKQSQTARILRLLRSSNYVTNVDLNKICFRYSARIHELRSEGWQIEREYVRQGVHRYWIVRENLAEDTY